jgi:hypothetical protein
MAHIKYSNTQIPALSKYESLSDHAMRVYGDEGPSDVYRGADPIPRQRW